MKFEGMYEDGWVGRRSLVALPGGEAGHLVLRADVLAHRDQRLELKVDGQTLVDRAVDEGHLDLRVRIPAAAKQRQVELTWAETTRLHDDDPREAAALIQFLDITHLQAPSALRVDALGNPAIEYSGITRDGWIERRAQVVLAGGPGCELVVRAKTMRVAEQRLELSVDDDVVFTGEVPEDLDLRIPIAAAEGNRTIGLEWSRTTAVSEHDVRQVAGHLQLIGLASGRPLEQLRRFPEDLAEPDAVYSGISGDGWVARDAGIVLAGGPSGHLVIRGRLVDESVQELRVAVDGATVATEDVAGTVALRIPIRASGTSRNVELHWSHAAPVSSRDPREAAAHLDLIGVSKGQPPTAIWRFPADLLNAELDYEGLFLDGWVGREAYVELAAGPAAALVLRGTLLEVPNQQLGVSVNGRPVASHEFDGTRLDLRLSLPTSDTSRRVELRWAEVVPISLSDDRRAAAHLSVVAILPSRE